MSKFTWSCKSFVRKILSSWGIWTVSRHNFKFGKWLGVGWFKYNFLLYLFVCCFFFHYLFLGILFQSFFISSALYIFFHSLLPAIFFFFYYQTSISSVIIPLTLFFKTFVFLAIILFLINAFLYREIRFGITRYHWHIYRNLNILLTCLTLSYSFHIYRNKCIRLSLTVVV